MLKPKGEVTGAKEAIKSLRRIDPELRKQFTKDAKAIAAPIIDEAKKSYPETMLSGMNRAWVQNDKPKFPYSAAAARRGLRFKIDTSKKAVSVIKVQQTNPAAAIIEVAGRRNSNRLGTALDRTQGRPSRFLWPAAERKLPEVQQEMTKAVKDVMRLVEKEVQ